MRRQTPAAARSSPGPWPGREPASGHVDGSHAIIGALLALAVSAWVVSALRMSGMDAGPGGSLGAFGFYLTTWLVMMTAMMLPSLTPVVLAHRKLHRRREQSGYPQSYALLLIGYLVVWTAAGIVGYAALAAGRSLDGGSLAWGSAGRWAAAAVLLLAALYELTPSKRACLARCRMPSSSLDEHWREGRFGALRMGARHGAVCLGCCWALMAALFALGVMSLVWMALISVVIAAEKLLPWRGAAVAATASMLAALAIGVDTSPATVPGFALPVSTKGMGAMGMAPPHARSGAPQQMRMPAPRSAGSPATESVGAGHSR